MDLQAALLDVQQRSVKAYLRRQQIQLQIQQCQMAAGQCDQELLMLDGEERALMALQRHQPASPEPPAAKAKKASA